MSSPTRLQKLREQRARANASKVASASGTSSNISSSTLRPTAAAPADTCPSWVEANDKASAVSPSIARNESRIRSSREKQNASAVGGVNNPVTQYMFERPSREVSPPKSSISSSGEWFQYTYGSNEKPSLNQTAKKFFFRQQSRSSDYSSFPASPSAEEGGFQSAKSRFESNLDQYQSASQPSALKSPEASISGTSSTQTSNTAQRNKLKSSNDSTGFNSAKSRFEITSSIAGRVLSATKKNHPTPVHQKREVPWPSESSSPIKSYVTPSTISRVTASSLVFNDKKTNAEVKPPLKPVVLDRFLAINKTDKSTHASITDDKCSNTSGIVSRSAMSAPFNSSKSAGGPLKRNMSTPFKTTPSSSNHVWATPTKINLSTPSKAAPSNNFVTPSLRGSYSTGFNETKEPMKRVPKSKSILQFTSSGSPVWIHASLLQESHAHHGWEWIRAFMHDSMSRDSVSIILADDGRECSIERRDDLILMGNSWWSGSDCEVMRQAPSPTSVAQFNQVGVHGAVPPDDLVELTHLHEPAIVHALQTRYKRDLIYTYTGSILLALNPFKNLDHLYTKETMELYYSNNNDGQSFGMNPPTEEEDQNCLEKLPPHAYAVAEKAYSCMLHSLEERDNYRSTADLLPCDQSILVSGESGAGKTETTKIIMRYLTILSQRRLHNLNDIYLGEQSQGLSVENQVLKSNPILESFGNSRTIRNDNSSRFGKFIQLSFSSSRNNRGTLLGASIQSYLLEKVRLVSINPGERSYHVFYEVLSSGMSLEDKKRFMLTNNFGKGSQPLTAKDFLITSVSGTFNRSRDGVKDSDTYRELRMAMDTVGFSNDEQGGMFSVVAGLLHASNLRFIPKPGDNHECAAMCENDETLSVVASLLGVAEEALKLALTSSVIEARGEKLIKTLSLEQCEKALTALVKFTYAGLFAFIVKRINDSIEVHGDDGALGSVEIFSTIGVLDIFGFESFHTNSFEQLCINYCNEALQQQFNLFVFKAEQADYEHEGITWSKIDFIDNQGALDLIEDRRLGIFSVLDEQCILPRCTDSTFIRAVYEKCEANSYFEASQIQKSKGTFVVNHYAGKVEYDAEGFLVKNKDELPKFASELLASSFIPLVSGFSFIIASSRQCDDARGLLKRSSSSVAQSSVSSQFASQLKDLRSKISQTSPHYIRCLKPNDLLVPDHLEESLIAHQLNCAGVLPALKLARSGYSMRYTHSSFLARYRVLVSKKLPSSQFGQSKLTPDQLISALSHRLNAQIKSSNIEGVSDVVSWGIQVGRTKVFLREPAFNALEEMRLSTINAAATKLQSNIRAYIYHSRFLRCTSRAIIIQKHWRAYYAWSSFQNILFIAIWCQRLWRGGKVRECYSSIKEYRSAITIQSTAAVIIQCAFRVYASRRIIERYRRNAKDVRLIVMERDRLRLEMKQMRLELEGIKRTQTGLSGSSICLSQETASKASGFNQPTQNQLQEIRMLHQECAKKDRELQELREKFDSLCGSKSIPSTLPTTVTISRDEAYPKAHTHSSNLLDSEIDGIAELECSAISANNDSFDQNQVPSLHLSSDSHHIESANMHELPLHSAIEQNNKALLLHEIERSSDVDLAINSTDSSGRTPLHIAVQCSNMDLILLILSHNVVVNTQDFAGNTALHFAKSFEVAEALLSNGANANIPNSDGHCAIHLAVKMQDFSLVRSLVSNGADVTTADDIYWYTPLHLVAQTETSTETLALSVRGPIAELLCESKHPFPPDLNYQDREGNTPLHWAASLAEEDAGILVSIFIEHGASPKIANNRGQTPIHLYCHNKSIRQYAFYHEALQMMLAKGDPNQQSLSGCTPLHLALYHRDYESARLLVRFGAELNTRWGKPLQWETFWTDMNSSVVLPLDMVEDLNLMHSIIADISCEQYPAPHRSKCMHCKAKFRLLSRKCNCSHCGRSICGRCSGLLQSSFIPHNSSKAYGRDSLAKVCILCEAMLLSSRVTSVPSHIVNDGNQSEMSLGTISM